MAWSTSPTIPKPYPGMQLIGEERTPATIERSVTELPTASAGLYSASGYVPEPTSQFSWAPGEAIAPRVRTAEPRGGEQAPPWSPPASSGGLRTVSSTPRSPTGQKTTTTLTPGRPLPKLPTIPEFSMPEWNEAEISKLTQKYASPGIRSLRAQVQQAQATPYENPNVKRMSLRDALQGYGLGLANVLAGAGQTAAGEYARKYQTEAQEAQVRHEDVVKQLTTNFEAAMQEYQNSLTKTTESANVYDDEEGKGAVQPFSSPMLRLNLEDVGPY